MKRFWRRDTDAGSYLWWLCPGCDKWHGVPTTPPSGDEADTSWRFSGTDETPTLKPSLRVKLGANGPECHFFLTEGKIDFCPDSFHELAGQKRVEVQEVPHFLWNEWDDDP